MSKRPYFSQYESPNIVIVPTVSFCDESEKKKMKLSPHIDEIQDKNDETLDSTTTNDSENNCTSVKTLNKTNTENSSKPHKQSNHNHTKSIKPNGENNLTQRQDNTHSKESIIKDKHHKSHKHDIQKHKEKKDNTSKSKNKFISKNKDTSKKQEKGKVEKTKSSSKSKTHRNDRDKNSKTSSRSKSSRNKTHKSKSGKSDRHSNSSTQKQTQAITHSNSSQKEDALNDSYENLTVTVETQNETNDKSGSPNTTIVTKTHKSKNVKLIINFVVKNENKDTTLNHDKGCTKKEDNITLISNSELSFLDDINIDEIVASLKQSKCEPGTIQQKAITLSKSPEGPIIIIDDDSEAESDTICKQESKPKDDKRLLKLKEDGEIKNIKSIRDAKINTDFKTNYINLSEERFSKSFIKNSSKLPIQSIIIVDEDIQDIPIEILDDDDDDKLETLSTCSTVILDSHTDFEGCNDILESERDTLVAETTESAIYTLATETKENNVEFTDQLTEIFVPDAIKNTETFKDPIEAQLKKIFEMPSSDTLHTEVDKNLRENLGEAKEIGLTCEQKLKISASLTQNIDETPTEVKDSKYLNITMNDDQITGKEEPEIITLIPKNQMQNPIEHKDCDSLNSPKNIQISCKVESEIVALLPENEEKNSVKNKDCKALHITKNDLASKEEPEIIASLSENEGQNPIVHNDSEFLISTRNDDQNTCNEEPEILENNEQNSMEHNDPKSLNSTRKYNQNTCNEEPEILEKNEQNSMEHNEPESLNSTRNDDQNTCNGEPEILENNEQKYMEHNDPESLNSTRNDDQNTCNGEPEILENNEQKSMVHNDPESLNSTRNDDENTCNEEPEILENNEQNPMEDNDPESLNSIENEEKNTCKEVPENIELFPENKEQNNVEHNDCESLDNTNNDVQCSTTKETGDNLNTPVIKNIATIVEIQKPKIDETVITKLLKCVKSENRKVEQQKFVPVTQTPNFIRSLEARMSTFLKTKYTVSSVQHRGKNSTIYKCIDRGGFNYALKTLNNIQDRFVKGIQKEHMHRSLQNNIPKENLFCIYVLNGFSMYGHWCLLMEYYPKNLIEALQENKKSFHIDQVQVLSKQLIAAVTVLRNNNIVHSDIKPSHILINSQNNRIKLCGFDTAYNIKDSVIAPNIGTVNYRPPEVILGYSSGFSLDVWSSALVMYELATNSKLFPGHYNNDILYKQMCTCGCIPCDMLESSLFKRNHFYGINFIRRVGLKKETKLVYLFKKSNRIHKTLFDTYTTDWSAQRSDRQRIDDLAKLVTFKILLDQMLIIHPRHRLSIEFVYANPFIYEFSDNC